MPSFCYKRHIAKTWKTTMAEFKYESSQNSTVVDAQACRANMLYDAARQHLLPLNEHLVTSTLDLGPEADQPMVVDH
jgi:hypothetical protein